MTIINVFSRPINVTSLTIGMGTPVDIIRYSVHLALFGIIIHVTLWETANLVTIRIAREHAHPCHKNVFHQLTGTTTNVKSRAITVLQELTIVIIHVRMLFLVKMDMFGIPST